MTNYFQVEPEDSNAEITPEIEKPEQVITLKRKKMIRDKWLFSLFFSNQRFRDFYSIYLNINYILISLLNPHNIFYFQKLDEKPQRASRSTKIKSKKYCPTDSSSENNNSQSEDSSSSRSRSRSRSTISNKSEQSNKVLRSSHNQLNFTCLKDTLESHHGED